MRISVFPSSRGASLLQGGRLFLFRGEHRAFMLEWTAGPRAGKRVYLDYSAEERESAAGFAAGWLSCSIRVPSPISASTWEALVKRLKIPVETRFDDVDIVYLSIHDEALWWSILHPSGSWRATTPRWRSGSWHVVEQILGKPRVEREIRSEHDVEIEMPEASYRWRIKLEKVRVWPHERLPFSDIHYQFEGEGVSGGIPMPGKGTTSYNCDEDALYSMGGRAKTVADAIALVQATVMNYRIRYGSGYSWRPRTPATQGAAQ